MRILMIILSTIVFIDFAHAQPRPDDIFSIESLGDGIYVHHLSLIHI